MKSISFLSWLKTRQKGLPSLDIKTLGSPDRMALVSVDMINGFCHKGPLSSPLVKSIIPEVVGVFNNLQSIGVEHFLLFQDAHKIDAPEFKSYPPHCIAGTEESGTIPDIRSLPFADQFTIFQKNSTDSFAGTKFDDWINKHPEVDTYIIVGNCTDICVYQVAIGLKTRANALNINRRVIVPTNAVATYDLPVEVAQKIGAVPHDASSLHQFFLYSMYLNGVEVVSRLF